MSNNFDFGNEIKKFLDFDWDDIIVGGDGPNIWTPSTLVQMYLENTRNNPFHSINIETAITIADEINSEYNLIDLNFIKKLYAWDGDYDNDIFINKESIEKTKQEWSEWILDKLEYDYNFFDNDIDDVNKFIENDLCIKNV